MIYIFYQRATVPHLLCVFYSATDYCVTIAQSLSSQVHICSGVINNNYDDKELTKSFHTFWENIQRLVQNTSCGSDLPMTKKNITVKTVKIHTQDKIAATECCIPINCQLHSFRPSLC